MLFQENYTDKNRRYFDGIVQLTLFKAEVIKLVETGSNFAFGIYKKLKDWSESKDGRTVSTGQLRKIYLVELLLFQMLI